MRTQIEKKSIQNRVKNACNIELSEILILVTYTTFVRQPNNLLEITKMLS